MKTKTIAANSGHFYCIRDKGVAFFANTFAEAIVKRDRYKRNMKEQIRFGGMKCQ